VRKLSISTSGRGNKGGKMKNEKKERYIVTTSFYIYAQDDIEAIKKAQEWAKEFDLQNDNWCFIDEIWQAPFAKKPQLIYQKGE
jgi:hypothetical protein